MDAKKAKGTTIPGTDVVLFDWGSCELWVDVQLLLLECSNMLPVPIEAFIIVR